jgi:hypothetical protein
VEDFLRWSPHVKNTRDRATGLGRDQLKALEELLSGQAEAAAAPPSPPRRPAPPKPRRPPEPRTPVEHYDDLAAEEVIALLASLENEDLKMLREYERAHANRARVLSAIDSVLARGVSRV